MCSLLFVCISSKDVKCYPIRVNDVWLNILSNMYFTCNRHAMKLICIVVAVGGPYASGALSAFVRVSRQKKTYCHVFCVILCHVCIFFLSNKQFSSSSSSSSYIT